MTACGGSGGGKGAQRCGECYPQPVEAGVAIEELHLFRWQGSQHFLDGKELVNLTLSREQWLPVAQLSQDAAH